MEFSQLHMHSLGLVSRIKDLGSHEVTVIPIEIRLAAQEEVISGQYEQQTNFATNDGEDNIKVVSDNSLKAQWLKFNSNRVTAPDVRRGDLVMIYRLGDSDKYFWVDYNSKNVKRLETVTVAFSADPNNPVADDLSNAYFLELSSHNKTVTFQTSQANGEPYGYTFQLNTDSGSFRLLDTAGNTFWLDSAATCIGAKNASGTWLHLDKKQINAYAPDSINLEAVKSINFKCKDFIVKASDSISFDTKAYTLNASSSITINTKTFKSTATQNTFDCPDSTFTGVVNAAMVNAGGLSVAPGAGGGSGACSVTGPMTANAISAASINCAGAIVCASIQATSATFASLSHGGAPCC